ncbi:MAG: hypothetical protein JMDDDDMK_01143 [Acidobacteria bacterium]|nr:hypothetical protein [Acidobacteriota bacterium]
MPGGVADNRRQRPVIRLMEIVVVAADLGSRLHISRDFEVRQLGHDLRQH